VKTLKQIADNLGVSKQRVYRFVKANRITEAHQGHIGAHYDEAAESLILSHFKKETASHESHQKHISEAVFNTVVDTLKSELEAKNRQIETLTAALNVAQQTATAAQALHAGTMKHLTDSAADGDTIETEPLPGWWARLMSRGKK
jgi:DNA-directed RNA polymerase specialized sigma subunit